MEAIASQNAPAPSLVVPHFLFGGWTWLCVTLLMAFYPDAFIGHYFNPKLLGITHLLSLGWITMVIFGALYQLVPVVLEVKLYSERLGYLAFAFLGPGSVLLAVAFWRFDLGFLLYSAAGLVSLAVVFFAVNLLITSGRSAKRSIEREFILTAVLWLLFTVAAGVTLGLNLTRAFLSPPHLELLKLHAHAGLVGWFMQLIMGVGSRLLPMFLVAHELNTAKLRFAYWTVNGGLLTGIFALILRWEPGILIGVAGVLMGILSFLSFLAEAYRKRVKKQLDVGMRQSVLSFGVLLAPVFLILLLVPASEHLGTMTLPLTLAYGSTLLFGFITSLIMGQTYKTLPFIVWLKVYRGRIGKGKTPLPRDLYDEQIAKVQLWLFAAGFLTLLTGIVSQLSGVITAGGVLLFFATALYNYNLLKIILHKPG